jgi:hypothetical protein
MTGANFVGMTNESRSLYAFVIPAEAGIQVETTTPNPSLERRGVVRGGAGGFHVINHSYFSGRQF